MKLILPLAAMTVPIPLLGPFIRFLGVAEVPGAIGLILPGLLRVRPDLTPPAAAGLMIIMTGATVITLLGGGSASALVPLIVGLLSGSVAYGRWRLVPLSPRSKGQMRLVQGSVQRGRRGVMEEPSNGHQFARRVKVTAQWKSCGFKVRLVVLN